MSQSNKHPLIAIKGAELTPYDELKAMRVCQKVALGQSFVEIFVGGDARLPTQWEFTCWALAEPELGKALEAARQLSAYVLEDEALANARDVAKLPGSPQRVAAYRVAMDQLRWSAERRNSGAFGHKGVATTIVPIQIITTLDLGQDGGGQKQGLASDTYTVRAQVQVDSADKIIDASAVEVVDTSRPAGLMSAAELLGETK